MSKIKFSKFGSLPSLKDSIQNKDSEIGVTILCLSYNHAKYLDKCLCGFLNQKVAFPIEILIHDDMSTDSSRDVILKYKEKYPNIIFPIFEQENQYSKGINIETEILSKYVRGKFIAICEGDDYWCDQEKLMKQYLSFSSNEELKFVVHKTRCVDLFGNFIRSIPETIKKTKIFARKKIVPMIIESYTFHTTSYFFRTADYITYCKNKPEFAKSMMVGDYPLQLYFSNLGKTLFINQTMSVHVDNVPGGWTDKMRKATPEKVTEHFKNISKSLTLFDEYTNFQFHKSILKRQALIKMHELLAEKKFSELLSNKSTSRALKRYDYSFYLSTKLHLKHPKFYSFLKRIFNPKV